MLKITDTIYLLEGRNNGRFPNCHCLYIKDDICALIDSAAGDDHLKPILGRVDILVNSHFHPDHVRGNNRFPNSHICCHKDDKEGLVTYEGMLRYTGYDRFTPEEIARFMPIIDHKPSRVDSTFSDGDILDFGRTKLRVMHTPGHTPGHCCFYEEKTGLMFGADIDLTAFGPWYAHEYSSLEAFQSSMEMLIQNPPALFVSGHENGCLKTGVAERLKVYAAFFTKREIMIMAELKKNPLTLEELAAKQLIYPRHPEPQFFFYYFEWQMIKKHLEKMQSENKIIKADEKYWVNSAQ